MDLNRIADWVRARQRAATQQWNVMVVPMSTQGVPKTFDVSRLMLQGMGGGALLLVALTVIAWTYTLRRASERHRAEVERLEHQLYQDKQTMAQELEAAQTSLEKIRAEMTPLLETENKMRAIAGLQPRYRDPEVGMGGQGGRGDTFGDLGEAEGDDHPDDVADFGLPEMPDWSRADVDAMLEEFSQLQSSYDEIEQSLKEESRRIDNTPMILPVGHPEAWISSGYGYREDPFSDRRRFHEGVDIVAPRGSDVLAPANGVVTYAGWKSGLGKLVVIQHEFGFETEYAHCDRLVVKKGDKVVRGQVIAQLGSTGRSTGPHLHYEVRRHGKLVNPYRYIID